MIAEDGAEVLQTPKELAEWVFARTNAIVTILIAKGITTLKEIQEVHDLSVSLLDQRDAERNAKGKRP